MEFPHTRFNHLRIMSSLASLSASSCASSPQRTSCRGVREPPGGRALFVYSLAHRSGKWSC